MREWLRAVLVASPVWALPLVGPHAVFLVGPSLWVALARKGAGATFWLGLAAVLAVQLALAAVLWSLRRRAHWVRAGALVVGLGAATVALNGAFLVGIPTLTLIERDPRPDVGELAEECTAPGYDMPFAPSPAFAALGRVLLRPVSEGSRLAWLSVPGCAITPTTIPGNAAALSSDPGGTTVYALTRPPDARYEWFVAAPERGSQPVSLAWSSGHALPVLLGGGSHVGWLEPRRTEQGYAAERPPFVFLVVQALADGSLTRTPLANVERGSWRLVDGDGPGGPFRVVRDVPREFRVVDPDGSSLERPLQPGPELERMLSEVALQPAGWLGWDVYAEDRRYVVAWDLPGGRGRVEEPAGRGITSAAADPSGRFVAYSTTTTLNVGAVPDAVALVRASDGSDVWRRRLPRYARAQVALFAAHLAWSDSTVVPPRVRVLRLPVPQAGR